MELQKYSALIFDCDGTLTDSMPIHYIAWRDTLLRYSIEFPEQKFYAMAGMPSDKVIMTLAAEQNVEVDVEKAMDEKENEFIANLMHLRPLEFCVDIARKYHGQMPLAVASGGTLPIVTQQLEHLGIIELFDAIVTAEHTQRHKPEPDVFLEAANRLNVPPEECLVFEDADLGVQAAISAKMDYFDVREIAAK